MKQTLPNIDKWLYGSTLVRQTPSQTIHIEYPSFYGALELFKHELLHAAVHSIPQYTQSGPFSIQGFVARYGRLPTAKDRVQLVYASPVRMTVGLADLILLEDPHV